MVQLLVKMEMEVVNVLMGISGMKTIMPALNAQIKMVRLLVVMDLEAAHVLLATLGIARVMPVKITLAGIVKMITKMIKKSPQIWRSSSQWC